MNISHIVPSKADLDEARAALKDKLLNGKIVGNGNLYDALDSEMQGESYKDRFDALVAILKADPKERGALVDSLLDSVADRYLAEHDDLVWDEACEAMAEEA